MEFLKEKTHPKKNWTDSQILWVLILMACSRTTLGYDLRVSQDKQGQTWSVVKQDTYKVNPGAASHSVTSSVARTFLLS